MNVGEGETACYWLEVTGTARVGIRRFTFGSGEHPIKCPASTWGHDAQTVTDVEYEIEWQTADDGYRSVKSVPDEIVPARDDPRWPTVCEACGEPFPEEAEWQDFGADGYVRSDTGETIWTRHVHGVEFAGALYDMEWIHNRIGQSPYYTVDRGDGIILAAVCPNGGMWVVDGKASSGGYWERSGDPRNPATLTVSPSIVCGPAGDPNTYHGFLQAGRFTGHVG